MPSVISVQFVSTLTPLCNIGKHLNTEHTHAKILVSTFESHEMTLMMPLSNISVT